MSREIHVRFREGVRVRFPCATRPVLVFESKEDAQRVMEVLPKRFGRYNLTVHPEKTRLIYFGKPAEREQETPKHPRWQKFDFMGLTHYWGRSRKGRWVIMRRTQGTRFTRALRNVADWCRRNRHAPLGEQQRALTRKLQGHYAYYGITGNARCLNSFFYEVQRAWHKWLSRRSRGQPMVWERFNRILQRYPLPTPRIVHSCYAANL